MNYTTFDFSRFTDLEYLEIGSDSFRSVETFIIDGMNSLVSLKIGERSFTYPVLSRYLDNPGVPAPDFIARSGGEKRLSGFLTLQSSYAEIGFYDKLWPDWDGYMIDEIISDFQSRQRRFGGLG